MANPSTGTINVGDVIRLRSFPSFTDAAGVAADPATVRLLVRRAGGSPKVYTFGVDAAVVKEGVGLYHVDYKILRAGIHYYRWEGSPNPQAAEENSFTALTSF